MKIKNNQQLKLQIDIFDNSKIPIAFQLDSVSVPLSHSLSLSLKQCARVCGLCVKCIRVDVCVGIVKNFIRRQMSAKLMKTDLDLDSDLDLM